jgi:hypothetical protein
MSGAVPLISCMLLLLTACATPPVERQFDGNYVGASTLARDGSLCGPPSEPIRLSIRDGTFRYLVPVANPYSGWNMVVPVNVRVVPGGAFEGGTLYYADNPLSRQGWRQAWVTVVGTVSGNHLEADVNSLNCGRHLSLLRS